jgi:predicted ATPase
VHATLWEAVRTGFVFQVQRAYAFVHDRVQETAYDLIAQDERAAVHLRIGRLLVSLEPEELEKGIFQIVNQLNLGASLVDSLEERERVAGLNLVAAKRAQASTAYASALRYLTAGSTLLTDGCWEGQYALAFALQFHRAECEFLSGDLNAAQERLSMLSRRASNLVDSAAVARLQTELYASLNQSERAVSAALEYLRRGGVDWSAHPTDGEAGS